jgi:cytochrome c553
MTDQRGGKYGFRIVEAPNDRLGDEWLLVRQLSDDAMDVEELSRHSSRQDAETAKAERERQASGGKLVKW